jgi:hypothetical protein
MISTCGRPQKLLLAARVSFETSRLAVAGSSQLCTPVERKGEPLRFALRFPSPKMITSIVIRPATCGAIWRGIVRAGRSRNAHRDGGDRQRERQCYLAQHDQSPCVEAAFGFRGLDRGTRHLFPRLYSNVVCSLQVFICSGKCADHIRVIVGFGALISGLPSKQTKISCLNATQGMDVKIPFSCTHAYGRAMPQ